MRTLVSIAGVLALLFGLGCLNYTKLGGVEHHREVARERGLPEPSTGIANLGMLLAPLGGILLGFAIGRGGAARRS